jgi:hypothetical protein
VDSLSDRAGLYRKRALDAESKAFRGTEARAANPELSSVLTPAACAQVSLVATEPDFQADISNV